MHIFVVPLLAGHIKVDNLVLVCIVDVESGLFKEFMISIFGVTSVTYLDVQLARLFILDDATERLRNGVKERGLSDTTISHKSYLESEMVVIVFLNGSRSRRTNIIRWYLLIADGWRETAARNV